MIDRLFEAIQKANKIVFFSGAGMSTASGIPDFRSTTGLYKNIYRAEEAVSHSFYVNHKEDFFDFYKKHLCFPNAIPNYGHKYIADLQKTKEVIVVTQNIDNLHQAAGSTKVYELHGSVHRNYCEKCHKFYDLNYILNSKGIPTCQCGGTIKPDVVLYEEGLDEDVIEGAVNAIATCDLMVILGTSLVVYPAASFVRYFRGETLAIINKSETSQDSMCDIVIHDDIVETFKKLNELDNK